MDMKVVQPVGHKPAGGIGRLLQKYATRVSDGRLARRRRRLVSHPETAPQQIVDALDIDRAHVASAVECELAARSAEKAGRFAEAAMWWQSAKAAVEMNRVQAVESGQWASQAEYERYVRMCCERAHACGVHHREAEEAAATIATRQGPRAQRDAHVRQRSGGT
ncbi:MAG TPA: hypothetical protein VF292_09365 [Rhodanobacteraceae bacterium]